MAGKVSKKTWVTLFFLYGIILLFSACMRPVDIEGFLDDDDVQKIINDNQNAGQGKVIIDPASDNYGNLKAENCGISGLTSGQYYRLEEYNGATFKRNLFVKADGYHLSDLSLIGKLSGTQIKDLKNDYTYKVKYARQFADGSHNYFAWGDTSPTNASVLNGEISITGIDDYYIDLTTEIAVNKDYEVIKIGNGTNWGDSYTSARLKSTLLTSPITAPVPTSNSYDLPSYPNKVLIGIFQYSGYTGPTPLINNTSLIKFESTNTNSDYVFAEYNNSGSVINFIVLTVNRTVTSSVVLSPTLTWTGETIPAFTGSSTVSQGGNINISVTVLNDTAFNSFKWYVDGTEQTLQTTKTLTITGTVSTLLSWYQQGVHTITLVAVETANSQPYSGTWSITCNP